MILIDTDKLIQNDSVKYISKFLSLNDYRSIVVLVCMAVIFMYILKNVFFIFLSWFRAKYSCKVIREISVEMMSSYMIQNYSFFLNTNTGTLMNGVTSDVGNVYLVISSGLKILAELMTILFIVIYMCLANWVLAVGVISLAFFLPRNNNKVFRKRMRKCGNQLLHKRKRQTVRLS